MNCIAGYFTKRPQAGNKKRATMYEESFKDTYHIGFNKRRAAEAAKKLLSEKTEDKETRDNLGTLSTAIHWMTPGKSRMMTRAPMIPAATGIESSANSVAFSPKIPIPKGSATRKVMKTPEKPQTFSTNFAAATSTVLPVKREASKSV